MQKFDYVILGGGVVAGYAAQEFAAQKLNGATVAVISADQSLPYERPSLSKSYLAGEDTKRDILINDPDFYEDKGIQVFLDTPIVTSDLKKKELLTDDDQVFGYGKLLIATGSRLRRLDLPGADDEAIYYLRWLDDASTIRERIDEAERAVVVGGGFIGLETASVLNQEGLEVTLVFPEPFVMESLFTPQMGDFFHRYYAQRGVELRPDSRVIGFSRANGQLAVELNSGDRLLADMAVVGIGVYPAIDLFADTQLRINNGILVNEYLETSLPDVYAAGDVVCYKDLHFDTYRHVEHWDNAVAQGKHAARVMTGDRRPFEHLPYFFSDEFDLSWEFWGDTANADNVIHRGDVANGQFSTWWIKEGRLVAAFVLDRPEAERKVAPRLIQGKEPAPVDLLSNNAIPLGESPILA